MVAMIAAKPTRLQLAYLPVQGWTLQGSVAQTGPDMWWTVAVHRYIPHADADAAKEWADEVAVDCGFLPVTWLPGVDDTTAGSWLGEPTTI